MRLIVTTLLALLAGGCQADAPRSQTPPPKAPNAASGHAGIVADPFMHPRGDLITGGQPPAESWLMLRGRDVSTVINLRTDEEMQGRDEAAEVQAVGLDYVHLPVRGSQDIDAGHADRLWQAIDRAPGRVMVHCASGNRVGALLALGAYRDGGMSAEQALAFGKRAGLTRLEPVVRQALGLPATP